MASRMKKVLCTICMRGGSKGVSGKNLRNLHGKPLMAYTIEQSLQSGLFEHVVVSTDSDEIAEMAKTYGADAWFLRPAELATDEAPKLPVIRVSMKIINMSPTFSPLLPCLSGIILLGRMEMCWSMRKKLKPYQKSSTPPHQLNIGGVPHPYCIQILREEPILHWMNARDSIFFLGLNTVYGHSGTAQFTRTVLTH